MVGSGRWGMGNRDCGLLEVRDLAGSMIDDTAVDRFYAHLEECTQCANHPFQLCSAGQRLIDEAAGFHLKEDEPAE